jgi:hypothetical protein
MRSIILSIFLILALVPDAFAQEYIFFLHNRFLQEFEHQAVHPEYGKVEYQQILDAFKQQNFTVISEIRPKGTLANDYAKKVKHQIDSIIAKGVKTNHITIVGTSMGGYIAKEISAMMKSKTMKFVLIGCCSDDETEIEETPIIYGKVLSIFEQSDTLGRSCKLIIDKSGKSVSAFKEIELHTGLKHGFLYKALPVWLEPAMNWAKGQE